MSQASFPVLPHGQLPPVFPLADARSILAFPKSPFSVKAPALPNTSFFLCE